ncbi:MAG: bifunctional (p)ppGpp synthetase/guanosine-3',5'-bis(diphosphate) 3'-pyrophosphohydrolase [Syntrophomonadaceae bacterium]|nr:bifunctional (p)ppGpp synthetase/guanosine-3',5'-bis(diphosphate) 3'-pyrophosphohydrolase [Syntrophomonadaceae bacterium]
MRVYDADVDADLIERAYITASNAHRGQTRVSGEPYIIHPMAVALILTEIEMDGASVCAALMHDVIEDTSIPYITIQLEFGEEIAGLVDGVTKLDKIDFQSREEAQAENLRKMFLAMARDIRVIIIKLADRLHNMRTLAYQPESKQQRIAEETMEIYAPLAHRVGLFKFKGELEDLAFYFIDPETYNEIARRLKAKRKEREEYIADLKGQIQNGLDQIGIKADIAGRPKNIYSIYKKMLKQQKDIDEIYDKIAIRVIVDDLRDCYGALGIIHTMWKPLPGRFKDYIATPKANMYQSLHTTLIGQGGEPFEVQIRTWEMHRTAEYGIAAHWRYKEGPPEGGKDKKYDEKLAWLRQILEWQQDVNDTGEFMEWLKIDLFEDSVFVFTPKGKVIELPRGSCPVDFAYRIHTEVGHKCTGARVNGRIMPLDFPLSNGDIVEVITSKTSSGPTLDWLNFVRTSAARNRIKQWFKRENRQENMMRGHEMVVTALKKSHLAPKELMRNFKLEPIAEKMGFATTDDLLVAVGDGNVTALQVINKIKAIYFPKTEVEDILNLAPPVRKPIKERDTNALRIEGVDDVLIRLAHCCNPLPGDEVLGYITRGRGVSVHRQNCPNMQHYVKEEPHRIMEVMWSNKEQGIFAVELEVKANDRSRLTMDVMSLLQEAHIPINSIYSRATKNNLAVINLKLEIRDMEQLNAIRQRIAKVQDVLDVRRVLPGEERRECE